MKFEISMEINGKPVLIGYITGESSEDAQFGYDPLYLADPKAVPISISLPLQEELFSPGRTKAFFDGLLPEGFTRRAVAADLRLDENDYVRILHQLGRECIGALRVSYQEETSEAKYERISSERIRQLASEGASESAALVIESRLSLAGATGKVGLYRELDTGEWYLPQGTAPSTHIVKQSHVRLKRIVPNELLCLMTAKNCGIDVPETFVIDLGSGQDEDILLASARFDRVFPKEPQTISGMQVPLRLHQEDFAQAMGIPSSRKYENGDHHMRDMFALLRARSARPVEDQLKLWDRIVFNYLIGNADGHIKNYSLLYSSDLRTVRLAPAYDVLCTTGYPGMTHEMAFAIGDARLIEKVTRDSFRLAAREAGLGERIALGRLDNMASGFRGAMEAAAGDLKKQGIPDIDRMKKLILMTGGITSWERNGREHSDRRREEFEH